jgi:hypothetical protein
VTSDFVVSKAEQKKPCQPHTDLITPGDGTATVLFTPSIYPGCGIATNYQVREFSTDKVLCESNIEKCSIKGLTNGVATEFYLVASNSSGNSDSDPAARVKQSVIALGQPAAPPLAVARVLNASKIRVLWTGGETDGGSPLTSFVATSNDGTLECTNLLTSQIEKDSNTYSCDINDPVAGKKYIFSVKAINKYGASLASPSTYEVGTSASQVESFEHKITVSDGFFVLGMTLSETGNEKNQVTCVRASTCSIIVPKDGKWSYAIQDEFAHTLIDSATNLPVSSDSELISDKDTKWIIKSSQVLGFGASARNTSRALFDPYSYIDPFKKFVTLRLEVNSFTVVAPLFTPPAAPVRKVELGGEIPKGMDFQNGFYSGTPSTEGRFTDVYHFGDFYAVMTFVVSKYVYGAPEAINLEVNGKRVSYTVTPESSTKGGQLDIATRAPEWEIQFYNASTQNFIMKVCAKTAGNIELGVFAKIYAKAFSGCSDSANSAQYEMSQKSVTSNTVAIKSDVIYVPSSSADPKVSNVYTGETLNVTLSAKPFQAVSLNPSSPLKVTDQERERFAQEMWGLTIDSEGKITGSLGSQITRSGFVSKEKNVNVSVGGLEIKFRLLPIGLDQLRGEFSEITTTMPAASPVGSQGKLNFSYKPAYTGTFNFYLELVAKYEYSFNLANNIKSDKNDAVRDYVTIMQIGVSTATYNSVNSAQQFINLSSNKIVLPGYVLDPNKEGFLPYLLPVPTSYRIRVEPVEITDTSKGFYYENGSGFVPFYSPEIKVSWPKRIASKPSAPTVSSGKKAGEISVSGFGSLLNYPVLPISVKVRACLVNEVTKCWEETFTKIGSDGSVKVIVGNSSKDYSKDYKVSVTFNIDPANKEWQTGPASDWSKAVKPKK